MRLDCLGNRYKIQRSRFKVYFKCCRLDLKESNPETLDFEQKDGVGLRTTESEKYKLCLIRCVFLPCHPRVSPWPGLHTSPGRYGFSGGFQVTVDFRFSDRVCGLHFELRPASYPTNRTKVEQRVPHLWLLWKLVSAPTHRARTWQRQDKASRYTLEFRGPAVLVRFVPVWRFRVLSVVP